MTKSKKQKQPEREVLNENHEFLDGKTPPNAMDLETQVLGAILLDNIVMNDVIQLLDYNHFYKNANGIIFQAMMNLEGRHEPIDIQTLKEELKRLNKLSEIGGVEYLLELVTAVATSANAEHYSRIIYEKFLLRNLIHISSKVVEKCFDPGVNTFNILDETERNIIEISESLAKKQVIVIKDEIEKLFDELGEQRHKKIIPGVPTGFEKLDELTSGFQKSELIVIAGRPSHGKTALAMNIARNAAVDYKKNVAFFSIEMTFRELMLRLLSAESMVNGRLFKTGKTTDQEWKKVAQSLHKLKTNLYIDDTSELTVLEIRAKARRLQQEYGIDMVIVDYLQLIKGVERYERRDLEVAYVSRSLKALAKELNIPVVACAQLNRGIEQRGKEKRPQLTDLRESGAIEQDADVVIFVHRPFLGTLLDETDPEFKNKVNKAEVIIGKQRNGPTDHFDMVFLRDFTKFVTPHKDPDIKIPDTKDIDQTPF